MEGETVLYEFPVTILAKYKICEDDVSEIIDIIKSLPLIEMLESVIPRRHEKNVIVKVGGFGDKGRFSRRSHR